MQKKWQNAHNNAIDKFLKHLNKQSKNYILKGGTALMMCYNLDRFSEDIDLDSDIVPDEAIKQIVESYCHKNHCDFRVAKETEITKRYMVYYNTKTRPLKIEVSYRNRNIDKNKCTIIHGINVYKINTLALMKAVAYAGRDKLRDIYDLTFITNQYWDKLSDAIREVIKTNVAYKGIEQLDYIINSQQSDELIDNDKLYDDFLKMYDRLNLLYENSVNG